MQKNTLARRQIRTQSQAVHGCNAAGQNIAAAGRRHAGIAAHVHVNVAPRCADKRVRTLQDDDCAIGGCRLPQCSNPVCLDLCRPSTREPTISPVWGVKTVGAGRCG